MYFVNWAQNLKKNMYSNDGYERCLKKKHGSLRGIFFGLYHVCLFSNGFTGCFLHTANIQQSFAHCVKVFQDSLVQVPIKSLQMKRKMATGKSI